MKRTIAAFIVILFLAHGAIGLERSIYINEIFSALGACILIAALSSRKFKDTEHSSLILMLVSYGAISFSIGYYENTEATLYQKSRTLPIIYSSLCFFVGYYVIYGELKRPYFSRLMSIMALPLLTLGALIGGKLSPPSTATLLLSTTTKSRRNFYIATILFILAIEFIQQLLFSNSDGSSTITAMAAFCITMYKFKQKVFKVIRSINTTGVFISILFFALSLKLLANMHNDFFVQGFSYFGDNLDVNSIWRVMFWAKTIDNLSAINWIFGIGLATPLFNEMDPANLFIIASAPNALDRPYTLGLHNSLLTYLVRLGAIGLLFLLCIIINILKSLARHNDTKTEMLFVSLCLILIPALFNVVLESPLYAGQFWIILGACSKHLKTIDNN